MGRNRSGAGAVKKKEKSDHDRCASFRFWSARMRSSHRSGGREFL